MAKLIDISKLNDLNLISKFNLAFKSLFGLELKFYPLDPDNIKEFCDGDEAKCLINESKHKIKCKKALTRDIKKAISKKSIVINLFDPPYRRLIVPLLVNKNVYGIAISSQIRLTKKASGKTSSKKPAKKGGAVELTPEQLKIVADFLKAMLNYVMVTKFKEKSFFSSDLAHSHLQESMVRAIEFIKENYYRPNLSLSEVSEEVNLSPYYFSHQFKKEYETTFIEYLTQLRLEAAVNLLKDMRLSIAQVSFAVGYQDPNYFSKVFKKWMNMSPQEYRDNVISQEVS